MRQVSFLIPGLRPRPAAPHIGVRSPARTCAGAFFEFAAYPSSLAVLITLMGAPTGAPAMAQELVDPTRPPAALASKAPVVEGGVIQPNKLQSVIISPKRKAAIINGEVVELGGKYGDAVLTKVGEDEVVLRSGISREVLKLYPSVEKVELTPRTATTAPRHTKPKAKAKAKPDAAAQPGASPAADGGTRAR